MNTKYEKELNRICLHIHVPETAAESMERAGIHMKSQD